MHINVESKHDHLHVKLNGTTHNDSGDWPISIYINDGGLSMTYVPYATDYVKDRLMDFVKRMVEHADSGKDLSIIHPIVDEARQFLGTLNKGIEE